MSCVIGNNRESMQDFKILVSKMPNTHEESVECITISLISAVEAGVKDIRSGGFQGEWSRNPKVSTLGIFEQRLVILSLKNLTKELAKFRDDSVVERELSFFFLV